MGDGALLAQRDLLAALAFPGPGDKPWSGCVVDHRGRSEAHVLAMIIFADLWYRRRSGSPVVGVQPRDRVLLM